MSNLSFFPIGLTIFAFALSLLVKSRGRQKAIALCISGAYLIFAMAMLFDILPLKHLQLTLGGWEAPHGISLSWNTFSSLLLFITGVIYFSASIYAVPGKNAESSRYTFPFLHILFCGITGAFGTHDLFNLYVWFEVTLLSSFVLLGLEGGRMRHGGMLKYLLINALSSLVFLLGAGLIYNAAHTLDFAQLKVNLTLLAKTDHQYTVLLAMLIFISFAIKSALFPFYFWLPASYHTISPAVSAVFAGLLTKVGLYAIFRVVVGIFPHDQYTQSVIILCASITILVGVAGAINQTNIRRILGFHIISQVGYIALAAGFSMSADLELRRLGYAAGIFYMIHHIVVKSNLYYISGLIRDITGTESLTKMQGLLQAKPLLAFLFCVPALSLAGIPPFSGFWAKLGLFKVALEAGYGFAIFAMIAGGILTIYSMAKIWISAFWGKPSEEKRPLKSLPLFPTAGCMFLAVIIIAIGLNPDLLYESATQASMELVQPPAPVK